MNGVTMAYLTVVTVTLLVCLTILTIKILDSRSRESKSRSEMMAEMVRQSGEVVKIQTALTETLLVGRPQTETVQLQELEKPSVTLPKPDELFRDLPDNIREAMLREMEEASTWPSPSERLPEVSVPNDLGEMEEQLRASLTPSGDTWVPQPEGSNSG